MSGEIVSPESAWRHVYRLLLWIDRTIGLAHCYESDKCQPGRPWYARSLRVHQWLSDQYGVGPRELGERIDWLFSAAVRDLSVATEFAHAQRLERAEEQRRPYERCDMPHPDEDLELEALVSDAIEGHLGVPASDDFVRDLLVKIKGHISSENKRKNLVGEGFEDTLAALLRRWEPTASRYEVHVRPALHELPGFYAPRGNDKTKKVDLALVDRLSRHRVLVSCKWSVRSDREEQFLTDFDAYSKLESSGRSFDYVLVTNEFDPARLAAACENRSGNAEIFTHVVHVNPDGPRAAYGAPVARGRAAAGGIERALEHVATGRLESLESWFESLST
ncbi:hypothetical protein IF188_19850 [Microbacterium sp. NEAU-LLC]|uniref:Restriction endonuclease n=1 Tax=Microbacterium helvum TaxID=2773713 RepID=A0ABR8NTJ9_9MICO|nr:hypothetical protein [Microbacterium helvum]MBD3943950.1 hypothetical protein [Microbacterium helvum]